MEPDCIDRSQQLPALLWQKVFLYLGGKPLAQVRLTCRTWKAIVDQDSELRDKFVMVFPRGLQWNSSYNPKFLHPAASGAFFIHANITFRSIWWFAIGARLTSLDLQSCRFMIYDLVSMLRATPNLGSLLITGDRDNEIWIHSGKRFTVDFQLCKLRLLVLRDILNAVEITSAIGSMHPPLKKFYHMSKAPLNDQFSRFVLSVAGTLEVLMAVVSADVLSKLSRMEHLAQLKHVTLHGIYFTGADAIALARKQPQLESLSLPLVGMTNEEICTILNAVPKLNNLSVTLLPEIDEPTTLVPSFLQQFPNVQKLFINGIESETGPKHPIRFPESVECLQLKDLFLYRVKIDQTIADFWKRAPKLTDLTLSQCCLSDWFTLADIRDKVTLLQKLSLNDVQIDSKEFGSMLVPPWDLKDLQLTACKWSPTTILALFCYCPKLEALSFIDMPTVTDIVLVVMLRWPNLKALTLINCPLLTEECADYILRSSAKFEQIRVHGCDRLVDTFKRLKMRDISAPLPNHMMKPDCTDRSQQLPALLWQKVFLYLGKRPLARVRLTCRSWKAIVDQCPALQDKFGMFFPRGLQWNSSYNPAFLHPAASGAVFIHANITFRGAWWCTIGARLTSLDLQSCRFTIYDLVSMLRATPNLRLLNIHQVEVPNSSEYDEVTIRPGKRFTVNFQLRKLQELHLHGVLNAEEITRVIERMRPPLKVFDHFSMLPLDDDGGDNLSWFMQGVAGTLETLTGTFSADVLPKLSRMGQLKHVTLLGIYFTAADVIALVRKQPQLESLSLPLVGMTNEEICTILNAVPKLNNLSVTLLPEIDEPMTLVPCFLQQFPNVQKLLINGIESEAGPKHPIRFPESVECLQLEELSLFRVEIGQKIADFWKRVPKLANLTLTMCRLSDRFSLADITSQAKLLQKLELEDVQIDSEGGLCDMINSCGLKDLRLRACRWSETALITLVCYCPKLEAVSLIDMPTVTDTVLLVITQRSNLKAITLSNCPLLTGGSANHIVRYGAMLKWLHIRDCEPVQKMIDFMKETGMIR